MDRIGKVQEAIKKFREKQKNDELAKLQAVSSNKGNNVGEQSGKSLVEPVQFTALKTQSVQGLATSSKDLAMEEFDQYVVYSDLQKKTELLKEIVTPSSNIDDESSVDRISKIPDQIENDNMHVFHQDEQEIGSSHENHHELVGYNDMIDEEVEDWIQGVEENEEDDPFFDSEDGEYVFPTPDEVGNSKKPEVGMVFPTLDDAVNFVNAYGKVYGFAVIKGRNYKEVKYWLHCNKSRKIRSKNILQRKRKRRFIAKTECQMNVVVKLIETKWQIFSVSLDHNHDCVPSPSLTKFFLSHRTMTNQERLLSTLLQEIRVKPQRIMTIFRRLKGNYGNLTFGKKMMDNQKQAERKMKRNSDITCTMKYIERIQLTKPGFCCKMQVDGEGSVRSLFWTDGRSRMDYKIYGEIICFDTTFSTNRYNMPFAPIIGINGHAKTIVFGWTLLKDQSADTFEWLFESFVEVMEGKRPNLILTDQDAGINLAVSRFFKDAYHWFCLYHVIQNLKENMGAYMAEKEGMQQTIISLITDSLHTMEFEIGWKEMVRTYDCAKHDHIKRMWDARKKFVSAYFKGCFYPFTRSTGRSESFNSNFKDYVMRKDTIENILKQYELFQENVIEIENEDRFETTQKVPSYWCNQPVERHAAKIYTKGIYLKFLTEFLNSTASGVTKIVRDRLYETRRMFHYKDPEYRREMFTLCADRTNLTFECECAKFEKDGILCCHILRLFTQWDIVKIPDDYIVERWTVEFREKELLKLKQKSIDVQGPSSSTESALRYAMLMNSVNDICADISRDANKSKLFIEEVQKLHKRLSTEDVLQKECTDVILKDPPVIKKKTAKSKSSKEELVAPEKDKGPSVNIWLNEDGSISKPVEDKRGKAKQVRNRKQNEASHESILKDPPVCSSISVKKGDRLKPQSEVRSNQKKKSRKNKAA